MQRLIKASDKKCFLEAAEKGIFCNWLFIVDNLKAYHGKKVKARFLENGEKVRIFYLPLYSPEINPDEYLNHALKQSVHKGGQAKKKFVIDFDLPHRGIKCRLFASG